MLTEWEDSQRVYQEAIEWSRFLSENPNIEPNTYVMWEPLAQGEQLMKGLNMISSARAASCRPF